MPLDGVYMMWISCYMQKKQKEKLDNHKLNIIKKKIGRKKKKKSMALLEHKIRSKISGEKRQVKMGMEMIHGG